MNNPADTWNKKNWTQKAKKDLFLFVNTHITHLIESHSLYEVLRFQPHRYHCRPLILLLKLNEQTNDWTFYSALWDLKNGCFRGICVRLSYFILLLNTIYCRAHTSCSALMRSALVVICVGLVKHRWCASGGGGGETKDNLTVERVVETFFSKLLLSATKNAIFHFFESNKSSPAERRVPKENTNYSTQGININLNTSTFHSLK